MNIKIKTNIASEIEETSITINAPELSEEIKISSNIFQT